MSVHSCFFAVYLVDLSITKGGGCIIFSFGIDTISMLGVLLSSFYIFGKAIRHSMSNKQKVLSVLWCLVLALLFAMKPFEMPVLMIRPIICVTSLLIIFLLTKMKLDTVISAYMLSFGGSYILFYIAIALSGIIFMPFARGEYLPGTPIDYNQPIYLLMYILVFIIQLILAVLFFRIRRFRKGFPFLFKRYAVIMALIFSGTILVFVTWVNILANTPEDIYASYSLLLIGILIIGIGIYIWIRRGIKRFQRKRIRERNEELLRTEVAELKQQLRQRDETISIFRSANHSINHRLAAMERSVEGLLKRAREDFSAEFSEELAVAMDDIRKMKQGYKADIGRVKMERELPSTNIPMIDEMFILFLERYADNNIFFKLTVNGSIIHMTDNAIKQDKLETMIGDHLQDALIAVNASHSVTRNVMAVIGEAGDFYEFSVHDSGIPFEADTLVRLGMEPVTTHAGKGGSGEGFLKTFETMRDCGASLIIREMEPGGPFTKSVTIRFDDQNQYIIETYRPGDFPENDRYIIAPN